MKSSSIVINIPEASSVDDAIFNLVAIDVVAHFTGVERSFTKVMQLAARITVVSLCSDAKNMGTAIQSRLGLLRTLGTPIISACSGLIPSKDCEVWTYVVANGVVRVKFYATDIEFVFIAH